MFPGWGMSGWMMAGGGIVLVLIVAALVVVMVTVLRHNSRGGGQVTPDPTPRDLLAQRYARGEIDDDEYFQRLSVLESAGCAKPLDRPRR